MKKRPVGRPKKEELVCNINLSVPKDIKKLINQLKRVDRFNCSEQFCIAIKEYAQKNSKKFTYPSKLFF